jgi:hypothetical protein
MLQLIATNEGGKLNVSVQIGGNGKDRYCGAHNLTKQSKAKQSKAKQSKAIACCCC